MRTMPQACEIRCALPEWWHLSTDMKNEYRILDSVLISVSKVTGAGLEIVHRIEIRAIVHQKHLHLRMDGARRTIGR